MTTPSASIVDALNWRYAVQMFDPKKTLAPELLHTILESGRLAPSSIGLEPWKFIVVENPEVRVKLRAVSHNQAKVTDAAVLVIIAYRTDAETHISRERIERTARIQGQSADSLNPLKQMMDSAIAGRAAKGTLNTWMQTQAYIPFGMMIETAALLGVDSGPMEGFLADEVDALLGLKEQGLHAASLLALGYRGDDPAALRPKVRRSFNDVVQFIR